MTHHDDHDDRRRDDRWTAGRGDWDRDDAGARRGQPSQADWSQGRSQASSWGASAGSFAPNPGHAAGWSQGYGSGQSMQQSPYGDRGAASPYADGRMGRGAGRQDFGGGAGWGQQHQFDRPGHQTSWQGGAGSAYGGAGWGSSGGYGRGGFDQASQYAAPERQQGGMAGYGPYAQPSYGETARGSYESQGWSGPAGGAGYGQGSSYADPRDPRGYGGGFVGGLIGAAAEALGFGPDRASRGRGPKGYVRSDARIEEDVNERLSMGGLDASEVTVAVKDGEVTLSGSVGSRWEKRRAEDLADDVSGVKHVQNNIRVDESAWGNGERREGAARRTESLYADTATAASAFSGTPTKTTGA